MAAGSIQMILRKGMQGPHDQVVSCLKLVKPSTHGPCIMAQSMATQKASNERLVNTQSRLPHLATAGEGGSAGTTGPHTTATSLSRDGALKGWTVALQQQWQG